METVKIKDRDNLVRDITSRAVINTNKTDYENYIARRKAGNDMKSRIDQNCKDIDCIKQDLTEVKQMLMLLIKQESK
jgi:hypothetical protein